MSNTAITTVKVAWSPAPGSIEARTPSRRLPKLAVSALAGAWSLFVVSLFLPAYNDTPGSTCALVTVLCLLRLAMGDIAVILGAIGLIPNIAIALSPLLLVPSLRRGRFMRVLTDASSTGATFALLTGLYFPITALIDRSIGAATVGSQHLQAGFFLWALSQFALRACIHFVQKSEAASK